MNTYFLEQTPDGWAWVERRTTANPPEGVPAVSEYRRTWATREAAETAAHQRRAEFEQRRAALIVEADALAAQISAIDNAVNV